LNQLKVDDLKSWWELIEHSRQLSAKTLVNCQQNLNQLKVDERWRSNVSESCMQFLSTLINSYQVTPTLINWHQPSSTLINWHQLLSTVINRHQLLSTDINTYQLTSTVINSYQLSSLFDRGVGCYLCCYPICSWQIAISTHFKRKLTPNLNYSYRNRILATEIKGI
jgi:hypothetical protein